MLYKNSSPHIPIAMCLILDEGGWEDNTEPWQIISVHGGGWLKDASSRFIYAKAWIRLIHFLHKLGCRILTDFNEHNLKAKHLILKTGFDKNNDIKMYEYNPELDKFREF